MTYVCVQCYRFIGNLFLCHMISLHWRPMFVSHDIISLVTYVCVQWNPFIGDLYMFVSNDITSLVTYVCLPWYHFIGNLCLCPMISLHYDLWLSPMKFLHWWPIYLCVQWYCFIGNLCLCPIILLHWWPMFVSNNISSLVTYVCVQWYRYIGDLCMCPMISLHWWPMYVSNDIASLVTYVCVQWYSFNTSKQKFLFDVNVYFLDIWQVLRIIESHVTENLEHLSIQVGCNEDFYFTEKEFISTSIIHI